MMKFIKDNEASILEHQNQYKSTKIDSELKMYLDNKVSIQSNIQPAWKPQGAFPINKMPLSMSLMGANMIQQQKNMLPLSQFPIYTNAPFNLPFMPMFNMNNNMMIQNQFAMQNSSSKINISLYNVISECFYFSSEYTIRSREC